jgi:hypothetical protein
LVLTEEFALKNTRAIIWLIVILLVLTGCGARPDKTTSPDDQAISAIPDTEIAPVDTPTPLAPVGVLLTPPGSDQRLVDELNPIIGGYIRDLGLRFQVLSNLTPDDFQNDDYQIVVVLGPFPELQTLVEFAPDTKFLAVGFNELEPAANLSILRSGGGDFDVQGFIAGYIAALITPDWRVGALSVEENPDALAARDGFRTGVKYYCGLCNPKYAPTGINYLYPKYIDLPVDATDQIISANVDYLVDHAVNTFYIVPGVGTPLIYSMLVAYEKNIIGPGSDYQEEYKDHWVVSLEYNLLEAVEEFWPLFIETDSGLEHIPPLLLTDINYDLFSEGKLMLVEKILDDVRGGFIKTRDE